MGTVEKRQTDQEVAEFLISVMGQEDDEETRTRTGRWNSTFKDEPTLREVEDFVNYVWFIKHQLALKSKRERLNDMMKAHAPQLVQSKLFTFAIDQDKEITRDYCQSIVDELRRASKYDSYAYLRGAPLRFEFYTAGDKFNPHLHFTAECSKKPGKMAELLRRKFTKEKYSIYRINIEDRTADITKNYVIDANKKDEKMPCVIKDNEFKKSKNIEELYII